MGKVKNKEQINRILDKFENLIQTMLDLSSQMNQVSKSTSNQMQTIILKSKDMLYRCRVKDSPPKE